VIRLTIPGEPVAQGRPRFSRRGKYVSTYDPPKSRGYKEYIKQIARQELHIEPLTGSIRINVKVYRGIQKSGSKLTRRKKQDGIIRPTVKPDTDNYYKAVSDALTGILWEDDNQIVEIHVGKWYSDQPRVEIEVEEID
jgi:Holliday junction resolvase RusA-like endonuclease